MSKSDTIEINPSDLSDEVRNDLTEELNIDSDYADEYAKELKVDELVDKDPDKTGFIDSSARNLKSIYTFIDDYIKSNTIYGKIVDIQATDNDYIVLKFNHTSMNETASCKMSPHDSTLSNIMEYHGVDNASELENKKVPIVNAKNLSETFEKTYITLPNNTSLSGKLRYRVFCGIKNAQAKTPLTGGDTFEIAVTSILFNLVILVLGTGISGFTIDVIGESTVKSFPSLAIFAITSPFIISLLINLVTGVYFAFRFSLFILSKLFEGDFDKINV